MNSNSEMDELRTRIASFAKRTLRREVMGVHQLHRAQSITAALLSLQTTNKISMRRISAFLQREDSYALPKQQRHLTR